MPIQKVKNICDVVKREAAKRYWDGEEVQVITGTNKDVDSLNRAIQEAVNPPLPTKPEITHRGVTVRQNDRVTILRNNREKGCVNGDVGIAKKMTVFHEKDQFADVTIALSKEREAKYRWLRGSNLPSVDNLYALSRFFEVSMEDVLVETAA